MERAIGETKRRRVLQEAHSKKYGITPGNHQEKIHDIMEHLDTEHTKAVRASVAINKEGLRETSCAACENDSYQRKTNERGGENIGF